MSVVAIASSQEVEPCIDTRGRDLDDLGAHDTLGDEWITLYALLSLGSRRN